MLYPNDKDSINGAMKVLLPIGMACMVFLMVSFAYLEISDWRNVDRRQLGEFILGEAIFAFIFYYFYKYAQAEFNWFRGRK